MTVRCIFFSPCGSTRTAALTAAEAFSRTFETCDLTDASVSMPGIAAEDIVIIAAPVYAGRIPTPMAQRLRLLAGCGARAVTLVTYGNRAFEDALLELNDIAENAGFTVVASAALVTEHVLVPAVATGRPNGKDLAQIEAFAKSALEKIEKGDITVPAVPGNRPYREGLVVRATPTIDVKFCTKCGVCVRDCPTAAIDPRDPSKVDVTRCINCMRCVKGCPQGKRDLPAAARQAVRERLSALIGVEKPNDFYL
ncbi:MAG: 4Fe-4S binding protein [Duodenibacillus sp.]